MFILWFLHTPIAIFLCFQTLQEVDMNSDSLRSSSSSILQSAWDINLSDDLALSSSSSSSSSSESDSDEDSQIDSDQDRGHERPGEESPCEDDHSFQDQIQPSHTNLMV